ncbi:hypothetical protein MIR68_011552 [Amoeboaphelidium protococcarum]|nr:hypothetical protein MIR68_011552 [Amoeboaphelidium protococcarum]
MELLMLVLIQALFMVVIKVIKMAMELMWVLLLEATYPELLNKLILYLQEFAIIKANVLYLRQLQVSDGLSTTARRVAVPQLTLLTCRWVPTLQVGRQYNQAQENLRNFNASLFNEDPIANQLFHQGDLVMMSNQLLNHFNNVMESQRRSIQGIMAIQSSICNHSKCTLDQRATADQA